MHTVETVALVQVKAGVTLVVVPSHPVHLVPSLKYPGLQVIATAAVEQVNIPASHAVQFGVAKKYPALHTEHVFVDPTNEHVVQLPGHAAHLELVVSHLNPGLHV